jgi:hypothetical protein
MINRKKLVASSLAALGLIAISAPTVAGFYEIAPNEDIDLCVAEIQAYADYTDATRVRHEVESSKRRSVGYSLKIDTTVYSEGGDKAIREYKAVCVVTGGEKPYKFSIEKTRDVS